MQINRCFGAIDIGTNSVRLLIADKNGTPVADKLVKTTRLGEGLVNTGLLSTAAMHRTFDAVTAFLEIAKTRFGCELPVYCYATSAVRQAKNGGIFMQTLKNAKGLECEILSEHDEALCAYIGADAKDNAIIDIGGGSTELIVNIDGKLKSKSITLGCVTALEKYIINDPPTKKEIAELNAYCQQRAAELVNSVLDKDVERLICVGGTATQMAMIDLQLAQYSSKIVNGYEMYDYKVRQLFDILASLSDSVRKQLCGMEPSRSDIIITGCAIALAMMNACGAKILVASDSDGLDGYLKLKINGA